MNESDLRVHLAQQTQLRLGLYDILALQESVDHDHILKGMESNDVQLFDVLYPNT